MAEKTYTTTEIGRICDVYPATVINWIESGDLKAYITPGGHRRVLRRNLIDFLKKYNIPVPSELNSDRKTIMVVDDDPEMIQLIERTFKKYEDYFALTCVPNGVEALLNIGREKPDLMILDIVMPGMDGFELCTKLRSVDDMHSIKILAMTGKKITLDKSLGHYGIHKLFYKPFPLLDLVRAAGKFLRIELPIPKKTERAAAEVGSD
ncbi:MAG: response regulator [Elusimicrobia bacterium]|nr:response regulator [Elusimicrobiota bacterium]